MINEMTVLEFLKSKLPIQYVVAVIQNLGDKSILDDEIESDFVSEELQRLFQWEISREGFDFWNEVYWAIRNGDKLPEIPFRAIWKPNTYLCTTDGSFLLNLNGKGTDVHLKLDFGKPSDSVEARILKEAHFSFCN